jgi:phytoene dehydrogenase-like protein
MRRRIDQLKTNNGLGVALRLALNGLPEYRAYPEAGAHTAVQLICPSMAYLKSAWNAYHEGRPSPDPVVAMMTFSAVDNTLSPPGKHVASIWAQYFPYQLADGVAWESLTESVAAQILDVVAQYAPSIRDNILDMVVQTPVSLEKELGLIGGDLQHLNMSPGQMFMFRPGWNFSQYSTPIKRLYLTGSSTHPGGGIMGMAGYNAANAILKAHP